MKTIISTVILITILSFNLLAQEAAQNIRGVVFDQDSKMTLPGANLVIVGSEPQIGTATDMDGNFVFSNLPIGRYDIEILYIGYETARLSNILLNAGKETVLQVGISESFFKIDEIIIKPEVNKSESVNKMAAVSAKKLNIEEASHVAGSLDDAGRMVSSIAGVTVNPGGTNDIIIRGNSPKGMLWRLEGIDIPNPNHFSKEGSSSGGISILNGAVLANSDFFTSAFPADYGNAYSGVFDMGLRTGNNRKREYTIQAGFKGLEATLEGPFSKKSNASYLFNYRYSTLSLFTAMGLKIHGNSNPAFQDITYKFFIPTKKAGVFTVFGIAGLSSIKEEEETFTNNMKTSMSVVGLKNRYFINETTSITSIIAYTGSKNKQEIQKPDSINRTQSSDNYMYKIQSSDDYTYKIRSTDDYTYEKPKIAITFNKKFNARNTFKAGINAEFISFNLKGERYNYKTDKLETDIDQKGSTSLLQYFVNWRHRFTRDVTLIAGLHSMNLTLNNELTIEPRIGLKWQFNPTQSLNFGLGMHSRMESVTTYFAQRDIVVNNQTQTIRPNEKMGLSKAAHAVLGYGNMLTEHLFLNVELYYQYLYNVPVEDSLNSSFSVINYNSGQTNRSLVNKGTGSNYGIEITLERYFAKNYYFKVTSSIFDSKYKAMDGVVRNTRYNSTYVFNVLGGKDFIFIKDGKKRVLGLNIKATWAGGQNYTPIDLDQSQKYGYTIRNEELAFSEQWNDFINIDFKISYSIDRKKASHVFELDMQNITNRNAAIENYYNADENKIKTVSQLGFIPIFNYRLMF